MSELKLFNSAAQKIKTKYGKDAMYGSEIDTVSKSLFGNKYKGSFAQDEPFEFKPGYYIINTDKKTGKGIHWIAMILRAKKAYIYDSYGRDTKKILKHLYNRLKSANYEILESQKDPEQKDTKHDKEMCGHFSIAWLYVAQKLGLKKALKI